MMFRFTLPLILLAALAPAQIRVGIVGTDTSHAPAFTSMLNDPNHKEHVPGARVVAAYKGGSKDLPSSWDRVDKYAAELQAKWGVEIVPDIPTLLTKVDAVLLESVDGRIHLAQFREIVKGGKPVFIDKPLASTFDDAREIARLARENNVRWFSTSSLRYGANMDALKRPDMTGAITWGPSPFEPSHHLDLSWYGIHAVEMLYALMGTGCVEVTRTHTDGADVVAGRWKDGRIGVARLGRPSSPYGAVVFGAKGATGNIDKVYTGYAPLVREIVTFFKTGRPPISEAETLELFAFMEAARLSKEQSGRPVAIPAH
jgi:hypothetical protein